MLEINDVNGASIFTSFYAKKCLELFDEPLIGCEMGIAYGGGPEKIGKLWKNKGVIYGFDTFEGHPQIKSTKSNNKYSDPNTCMEIWYSQYGKETLSIEYQQNQLDLQNLDNVKLIKGYINSDTDLSYIDKLHYCFLDLDHYSCMKDAYNLVKSKIVKNGFLLLHDVIPNNQIEGLYDLYCDILFSGDFEIEIEAPSSCIAILRKIKDSDSRNLAWL